MSPIRRDYPHSGTHLRPGVPIRLACLPTMTQPVTITMNSRLIKKVGIRTILSGSTWTAYTTLPLYQPRQTRISIAGRRRAVRYLGFHMDRPSPSDASHRLTQGICVKRTTCFSLFRKCSTQSKRYIIQGHCYEGKNIFRCLRRFRQFQFLPAGGRLCHSGAAWSFPRQPSNRGWYNPKNALSGAYMHLRIKLFFYMQIHIISTSLVFLYIPQCENLWNHYKPL